MQSSVLVLDGGLSSSLIHLEHLIAREHCQDDWLVHANNKWIGSMVD